MTSGQNGKLFRDAHLNLLVLNLGVMPKTEPKTRKERRTKRKEHYMDGVARRPHTHTRLLQRSFEEDKEDSTLHLVTCPQCYPIL